MLSWRETLAVTHYVILMLTYHSLNITHTTNNINITDRVWSTSVCRRRLPNSSYSTIDKQAHLTGEFVGLSCDVPFRINNFWLAGTELFNQGYNPWMRNQWELKKSAISEMIITNTGKRTNFHIIRSINFMLYLFMYALVSIFYS